MITDHKITDKKLQCNINRAAAKVSALSSGKVDKYEYLTGREILPSDQSRMMDKAKFIILLKEKLSKNKQKQLEIKVKTKKGNWRAWKNAQTLASIGIKWSRTKKYKF